MCDHETMTETETETYACDDCGTEGFAYDGLDDDGLCPLCSDKHAREEALEAQRDEAQGNVDEAQDELDSAESDLASLLDQVRDAKERVRDAKNDLGRRTKQFNAIG